MTKKMKTEVKIKYILDSVSEFTGIPVRELSSKKRHRPIVTARIIHTGLCDDFVKEATLGQITAPLRRGHDMAIHYRSQHRNLMELDKEYRSRYRKIRDEVEKGVSKRFTIKDVKYKNKMRQAHYETQMNVSKMTNMYYSAIEVLQSTIKEIEEDYCMSLEGFRRDRMKADIQKRIAELKKIKMS